MAGEPGRSGDWNAHVAQLVEHVLGKDEVTSSNLVVGSNRVAGRKGGENLEGIGREKAVDRAPSARPTVEQGENSNTHFDYGWQR